MSCIHFSIIISCFIYCPYCLFVYPTLTLGTRKMRISIGTLMVCLQVIKAVEITVCDCNNSKKDGFLKVNRHCELKKPIPGSTATSLRRRTISSWRRRYDIAHAPWPDIVTTSWRHGDDMATMSSRCRHDAITMWEQHLAIQGKNLKNVCIINFSTANHLILINHAIIRYHWLNSNWQSFWEWPGIRPTRTSSSTHSVAIH